MSLLQSVNLLSIDKSYRYELYGLLEMWTQFQSVLYVSGSWWSIFLSHRKLLNKLNVVISIHVLSRRQNYWFAVCRDQFLSVWYSRHFVEAGDQLSSETAVLRALYPFPTLIILIETWLLLATCLFTNSLWYQAGGRHRVSHVENWGLLKKIENV